MIDPLFQSDVGRRIDGNVVGKDVQILERKHVILPRINRRHVLTFVTNAMVRYQSEFRHFACFHVIPFC